MGLGNAFNSRSLDYCVNVLNFWPLSNSSEPNKLSSMNRPLKNPGCVMGCFHSQYWPLAQAFFEWKLFRGWGGTSAGRRAFRRRTRTNIARSTSNDANKTRNKPLSDTRVLIARVPKSGHARRVRFFLVSVIASFTLNVFIPWTLLFPWSGWGAVPLPFPCPTLNFPICEKPYSGDLKHQKQVSGQARLLTWPRLDIRYIHCCFI